MSIKQETNRLHIIGAYLSPHNNTENTKTKATIKNHVIRIKNLFKNDEIIIAGDWNQIHI
jgi:hypothetical protein